MTTGENNQKIQYRAGEHSLLLIGQLFSVWCLFFALGCCLLAGYLKGQQTPCCYDRCAIELLNDGPV